MLESEKFAIAARLHVVLRRKLGRVTDVEWMVRNREYALEVLRVAREQRDPDFSELADKFEATLAPPRPEATAPRRMVSSPPALGDLRGLAAGAVRYVGSLR